MKKILFLTPIIILSSVSKCINPQDFLHQAIINDSLEQVLQAAQSGASVDQINNGMDPILLAVILKKANAVNGLILCGAKTNISHAGNTLTLHALKNHDHRSALLLIKSGSDFSGYTTDRPERTAMFYALQLCANSNNGLELMQELINRGYDIHSNELLKSHHNSSIWSQAFETQGLSIEALKLIIKNGANPNQIITEPSGKTTTPLVLAIGTSSIDTVKVVLEAGANINQKINAAGDGLATPLAYTIRHYSWNTAMIQFLMQNGASI